MSVLEIAVEVRSGTGKGPARQTRMKKLVPGILYGENGGAGTPLMIDDNKLRLTLKKRPTMLKLTGGVEAVAVVRELQRHPVTGAFVHIDFQAIKSGDTVRLSLPLNIVGTSIGVKDGGVLEQHMHHVEVEANPLDAPDAIDVDITNLKKFDKLHVRDLVLPAGAKMVSDPDDTVIAVHAPKTHDDVAAGGATAEPVVLTERKKDA